jgi:hypothetical protein
MDLVDYSEDVYARIVHDFLEFAERSGIRDVRFVPLSALTGDMVVDRGGNLDWYDGPTLLQILETVEVPQTPADAPLRFPVQFVARPTVELPRGYMGRIESGSVAVGDRVAVLPSGATTRVREIRPGTAPSRARVCGDHRVPTTRSTSRRHAGRRCRAIARRPQRRGDAVLAGDAPLDTRRKYLLRHTRETRARIDRIATCGMCRRRRANPRRRVSRETTLAAYRFRSRSPYSPTATTITGRRQLHPDRRDEQQHRRSRDDSASRAPAGRCASHPAVLHRIRLRPMSARHGTAIASQAARAVAVCRGRRSRPLSGGHTQLILNDISI